MEANDTMNNKTLIIFASNPVTLFLGRHMLLLKSEFFDIFLVPFLPFFLTPIFKVVTKSDHF